MIIYENYISNTKADVRNGSTHVVSMDITTSVKSDNTRAAAAAMVYALYVSKLAVPHNAYMTDEIRSYGRVKCVRVPVTIPEDDSRIIDKMFVDKVMDFVDSMCVGHLKHVSMKRLSDGVDTDICMYGKQPWNRGETSAVTWHAARRGNIVDAIMDYVENITGEESAAVAAEMLCQHTDKIVRRLPLTITCPRPGACHSFLEFVSYMTDVVNEDDSVNVYDDPMYNSGVRPGKYPLYAVIDNAIHPSTVKIYIYEGLSVSKDMTLVRYFSYVVTITSDSEDDYVGKIQDFSGMDRKSARKLLTDIVRCIWNEQDSLKIIR